MKENEWKEKKTRDIINSCQQLLYQAKNHTVECCMLPRRPDNRHTCSQLLHKDWCPAQTMQCLAPAEFRPSILIRKAIKFDFITKFYTQDSENQFMVIEAKSPSGSCLQVHSDRWLIKLSMKSVTGVTTLSMSKEHTCWKYRKATLPFSSSPFAPAWTGISVTSIAGLTRRDLHGCRDAEDDSSVVSPSEISMISREGDHFCFCLQPVCGLGGDAGCGNRVEPCLIAPLLCITPLHRCHCWGGSSSKRLKSEPGPICSPP